MAKRICSLPKCENKHYGKGYCEKHWARLVRHGSAEWEPARRGQECSVEECDKKTNARRMCSNHYDKWRKYGDPLADHRRTRAVCVIADCEQLVMGRGWCSRHYQRWLAHGDPEWEREARASCDVDGCEKPPHSTFAALCWGHYNRVRRYGTLDPGQCDACQEPLPPEYGRKRKHCDPCRLARSRAQHRDASQRRRLLMTTGPHERIDSLGVYERDGWKCGLCMLKVNPKLEWPHPKSASLDHIIPLAEGGHHIRTNVHLAHLECNVTKGHRGGGEQLMLLG